MFNFTATEWVLIAVRTLIVLAFVIVGWRDISMLFRRPAANMGTGFNRIWAVGRTTLLEAWAGRIWLLPILWLVAAFIMINVIRVLDPTERMPLVIRALLDSQTYLLLVMMWVMACISLPRERERKIMMTNASKPLSRLEIVLGKMFGFTMASAGMLAVMGLLSWGILEYENHKLKQDARDQFELQKSDYSRRAAPGVAGEANEAPLPPSQTLNRLAEEGSLFAGNFVLPAPNGMSILGDVDLGTTPPARYLKGGSSEKAIYHFTQLPVPQTLYGAPTGFRPYFIFRFNKEILAKLPPTKVQIRVSAIRSDPHISPPPKAQEKVLTLNEIAIPGNTAEAPPMVNDAITWEPDDPDELYTWVDAAGSSDFPRGSVNIEVTCMTPGVYLEVWDGKDPVAGSTEPPPDSLFNVYFVASRANPVPMVPQANPITRGFERRDRQEISGPKDNDIELIARINNVAQVRRSEVPVEGALYHFAGADLQHITLDGNGNFRLSYLLEEYKSDQADLATGVRFQILNADAPQDMFDTVVPEIAEKRLMGIDVPKKYLGDKGGDMYVWLTCISRNHAISVIDDSVRIELPETPFVVNLFKSEVVIFFEAMLLIVICVTCSVRVNWPVAMFCAAVCVIFGWFVELIAGLQEYGGLGSLNYHAYNGRPSAAYKFFDTLAMGTWNVLGIISAFVPNFTIYKPTDFISNLQNTPWSIIMWNGVWTIIFILPFIAISHLLFRKQEVG